MAVTMAGRGDPSSRRGAVVNLGIFAVLLLIIAPLALRAAQPPPPSIAEFAPVAKQIKEPPKEQSGIVGHQGGRGGGPGLGPGQGGGGGGVVPSGLPVPTPTSPIKPQNVHHCKGNPPRQIEDPQSPPCVAYWDPSHGNGCKTSPGVDCDTIKVFVWDMNWGDTAKYSWVRKLAQFFNDRFEFYGRHLDLIYAPEQSMWCGTPPTTSGAPPAPPGSTNEDSPAKAQQNANDVASFGVFASTEYCPVDGSEVSYYLTLRNHGIISTFADPARQGESDFYSPNDPYLWNALPGVDVIERNVADWACRGLAGRKAQWANPAGGMTRMVRRFGIGYTTVYDQGPDLTVLQNALAACGQAVASADVVQIPVESQNGYALSARKLESDGVTTLICMCDSGYLGYFMHESASVGYYPEWYVNSYYLGESEAHAEILFPQDEAGSAFGLSFVNKRLPISQQPWYWGCKEEAPTQCGDFVPDTTQSVYSSLLMLASGIQMAGPNLTPETFRDALMKTHFPDPGAGVEPYFQAGVGFEDGDHTFNNDAAIMWYSPQQQSVETGDAGAWCYAYGGQRFVLGQFPANDGHLFSGTCH